MISMMFMVLFIFGAVHMGMFAITKYMASYNAFYAARTAMVTGGSVSLFSKGGLAARAAMQNWKIATLVVVRKTSKTYRGVTRDTVRTASTVPFGAPIFKMIVPFVAVIGSAPVIVDQVPDTGDNK